MKYKAWANDKKWLPEGPCCQMLNGFPEGKTLSVHQLKGSVLKYKTPSLENRQWWDESASDEMLRDDNKQQWPLKRLKATISPKKTNPVHADQGEREKNWSVFWKSHRTTKM